MKKLFGLFPLLTACYLEMDVSINAGINERTETGESQTAEDGETSDETYSDDQDDQDDQYIDSDNDGIADVEDPTPNGQQECYIAMPEYQEGYAGQFIGFEIETQGVYVSDIMVTFIDSVGIIVANQFADFDPASEQIAFAIPEHLYSDLYQIYISVENDPDCTTSGTLYVISQYEDNDGDGFSEEDGDCNDEDSNIHPAMPEYENGMDDNCDGVIDEGYQSDRELDIQLFHSLCFEDNAPFYPSIHTYRHDEITVQWDSDQFDTDQLQLVIITVDTAAVVTYQDVTNNGFFSMPLPAMDYGNYVISVLSYEQCVNTLLQVEEV